MKKVMWSVALLLGGLSFLSIADAAADCWQCADVSGRATCIDAGSTAGKSYCDSSTSCSSSCTSGCTTSGNACSGSPNCVMVAGEMICEEHKDVTVRTSNGSPWQSIPAAGATQGCA